MEVRIIAVGRGLFSNTLTKNYLTWQPTIMISVFLSKWEYHIKSLAQCDILRYHRGSYICFSIISVFSEPKNLESIMELEWESDFETGNEYVDGQHRYYIDLINRIRESHRETNDIVYKEKLISELRKYADFRFTSKENMATYLGLSGVGGRHQRHLELLEEFNHHAQDLQNDLKTTDEFLDFLTDWFMGHTVYEDQKLFKKNI